MVCFYIAQLRTDSIQKRLFSYVYDFLVDIHWNITSLYLISGSWINYICKMLSIAKLNNYANPLTFEAKIFLKVDKPIAHK